MRAALAWLAARWRAAGTWQAREPGLCELDRRVRAEAAARRAADAALDAARALDAGELDHAGELLDRARAELAEARWLDVAQAQDWGRGPTGGTYW